MTKAEGNAVVFPGAIVTTLARLVKPDGSLVKAAAVLLKVFEKNGRVPIAIDGSATEVVVPTSAVASSLSTGDGWRTDAKGHNFSHSFDIESYLTGGKAYRMEYRITTVSSGDLFVVANVTVAATGQAAT